MNFPAELIHAAGALPVVVQENREPITLGRSLLYEYYCAYTRSIADQAATRELDVFDAFFFVDHCVALIGAVDAMRFELPDKPMRLAQYTASMDEAWTPPEVRKKVESLREQLEELTGASIIDGRAVAAASGSSIATASCCARSTTCADRAARSSRRRRCRCSSSRAW